MDEMTPEEKRDYHWSMLSYLSGSGTVTASVYVLHSLVDDYGNLITPPELSHGTFLTRYRFFQEE